MNILLCKCLHTKRKTKVCQRCSDCRAEAQTEHGLKNDLVLFRRWTGEQTHLLIWPWKMQQRCLCLICKDVLLCVCAYVCVCVGVRAFHMLKIKPLSPCLPLSLLLSLLPHTSLQHFSPSPTNSSVVPSLSLSFVFCPLLFFSKYS